MIFLNLSIRGTTGALSAIGGAQRRAETAIGPDSPVPGLIWKDMQIRVDAVFQANRKGGTFRGVTWKWFADQYTRKTDGVVVPAQGGVPRLRGGGLVRGRKRPSGTRVTASSSVMQDLGDLRRGAASVLQVLPGRMVIGTDSRVGERAQYLSRRRPFLFWYLPDDEDMVNRYFQDYIRGDNAGSA